MSYTHLRRTATKLKEQAADIMWNGTDAEREVAHIVEHTCQYILGEDTESPLPSTYQKPKKESKTSKKRK